MPDLQAHRLNHEALYQTLNNGSLDADSFDHESHIRLAWYYLTHWPYDQAVEKFNMDFYRFIVRAGAKMKYHKTITDALLRLIASHLGNQGCRASWEVFKLDARPLFVDARAVLNRFYSPAVLNSDTARQEFVDGDLAKLPEPERD